MAAPGKKGKTKWKSVPADSILAPSKSLSWADEADRELDRDIPHALDNKHTKVELPTAPRASRASAVDESKIPYTGPFQAYISNVPYDLNEEELINFFQDLKIKSVRLPREERSGNRAKGFGYIEFEDRASLSAALSRGDTMLKGRSIHIELATNSDRQGGQRGRRDGGRDQHSSDRTTGNWRSGPRQDDNEERGGGYDRGGHGGRRDYGAGGSGFSRGGYDREERGFNRGGGGGFDREDRGGGGGSFHRGEDRDNRGGGGGSSFDRFDRGGRDDRREGDRGFGDRDHGGRDNRDRGFGGRDRDGASFGYNDRGGGGGFRDKDRGGGYGRDEERGGGAGGAAGAGAGGGSSSGHWRDEPRENRGFGNRGFDDRNRDRDRDSKFGPPRRDDTQLPERTRTTESGTRPKIVLQPRTKPIEPAASDGASSASASIFGGAKPVDTAAREREIEERLMRNTEDFSEASYRGGKSGPGSTGSRGEKQQWTDEKRVEPAPPPKENAWARKPPTTVVNNGRSTPEEERSQSQQSGNAQDSSDEPSSEPKPTEETRRGGGAVPSRSTSGTSDRSKSKGKESDRQSSEHRERKEGGDDLLKMPKVQASRPPNFAGSNKYSSLVDSDEAPNE